MRSRRGGRTGGRRPGHGAHAGSVSEERFELQKQGYVAAFRHGRVLQAVRSGGNQAIAVTMVVLGAPERIVATGQWEFEIEFGKTIFRRDRGQGQERPQDHSLPDLEGHACAGAAGRIHFVHFRDVRGTPEKFVETFVDEGPTDMAACIRAYLDAGEGSVGTAQAHLERALEIRAKEMALERDYEVCPACFKPVDKDFLICPYCMKKLRKPCVECGKALKLNWSLPHLVLPDPAAPGGPPLPPALKEAVQPQRQPRSCRLSCHP